MAAQSVREAKAMFASHAAHQHKQPDVQTFDVPLMTS